MTSFWVNNNNQPVIFDSGKVVNIQEYPTYPYLWLSSTIDSVCTPFHCVDRWRQWIGIPDDDDTSWLSLKYQLPSLSGFLPLYSTYGEFLQLQVSNGTNTSPGILLHVKAMYQFAFHTSSTTLSDLTVPTTLCITLMVAFLLRQLKLNLILPFFSNVGRNLSIKTHGVEWIKEKENKERIYKFGEYWFRLLFHSCISICALYSFHDEPWWTNAIYRFRGFPYFPMSPAMTWYYIFQCAYNVDAMVSLLLLSFQLKIQSSSDTSQGRALIKSTLVFSRKEGARGDFNEMFFHHLATNALIFLSSKYQMVRTGVCILFLHDVSDVLVDVSKLAHFLKWKLFTIVAFTSMCVVWVIARLYLLPIVCIGVHEQSVYVIELLDDPMPVTLCYICIASLLLVLLSCLILLHAYWFSLFVKIWKSFLFKREYHDYSEHKNGEYERKRKEQ